MTRSTTAPVARAAGRLPLLGHAAQLLRSPMDFLLRLRDLGDVVEIGLGWQKVFVLNDPALIQQVLVADAQKFDKGSLFEKAGVFFGNGLGSSTGEFHLRQRRMVQPAFHRDRFAKYLDVMNETAWEKVDSWTPGQEIDALVEMQDLAFATTARTLFSTTLGAAAIAEMHHALPVLLKGITLRALSPFPVLEKLPIPANRRFDAAVRQMRDAVSSMVAAYREEGVDHGDFMSLLLRARDEDTGEPMPDKQIRDEAVTFMITSSETSATMLAWVLHHLAEHPDVEEAVRAEIDTLGGRPVELADLPKLAYTTRMLTETLRVYPIAILPRRALVEVTIAGRAYPAGTQFFISPHALQHDARFYPEPTVFDPDRWLPERMKDFRRDTFLTFGAGVRKCVGEGYAMASMSVVLAAITPRWRLVPDPDYTVKPRMTGVTTPGRVPMTVVGRGARTCGHLATVR